MFFECWGKVFAITASLRMLASLVSLLRVIVARPFEPHFLRSFFKKGSRKLALLASLLGKRSSAPSGLPFLRWGKVLWYHRGKVSYRYLGRISTYLSLIFGPGMCIWGLCWGAYRPPAFLLLHVWIDASCISCSRLDGSCHDKVTLKFDRHEK